MDEQYYHELLRKSEVPLGLHDGLVLYLCHGIHPGDFLGAVLCNQLRQAVNRADETSAAGLVPLVRWLYMAAPSVAWGSESNVTKWMEMNHRQRRPA